jgi:hypothetical protein
LLFEKGLDFPVFSFQELLENPEKANRQITQKRRILQYFNEYLEFGYYPFFTELKDIKLYQRQMSNIIDKIIYEDITSVYNLKTNNLITFKQILYFFTSISPGEVNINKLANSLNKNHATISEYLKILQEANLIRFLTNDKIGHLLVRNVEKIYLDNTNLLQTISVLVGKDVNIGTKRETFFLNQLQNIDLIPCYSKKGDFTVQKYTFEIGGKRKKEKQIEGVKNSFLVLDDIIFGSDKRIPLYLFGFLY